METFTPHSNFTSSFFSSSFNASRYTLSSYPTPSSVIMIYITLSRSSFTSIYYNTNLYIKKQMAQTSSTEIEPATLRTSPPTQERTKQTDWSILSQSMNVEQLVHFLDRLDWKRVSKNRI